MEILLEVNLSWNAVYCKNNPTYGPRLTQETVLRCTHNLCFEQKSDNIITNFHLKMVFLQPYFTAVNIAVITNKNRVLTM